MRPAVPRLVTVVPVALLSAALLLASGAPLDAAQDGPPATAARSVADDGTTRVERLLRFINRERAQRGLRSLRMRPGLRELAELNSRRMARRGELAHTGSLGDLVCCWSAIAENVGYAPTTAEMHRAFMDSDAHRRNLLHPGYRHVGLAVVREGRYVWVTEVFRRPR